VTVDELADYEALMVPGEPPDLLDALRSRPPWMADALCRAHPEVEFVPPPGGFRKPPTAAERAAVAVCSACPVVSECLAYATEHGESGIWGGLTERERRRRAA
jgi:WhiB family redox-sensing transcriptional regulator